MRILLLLLVFIVGLVASTTRFSATLVYARVTLRCKAPRDAQATVFLMESDFQDHAFDEDDTFDFATYHFGKQPEMKVALKGEEFEFSGLDPYIYVLHSCTKTANHQETFVVPLMESMYRSRSFDVIIDLDRGTSVVTHRRIHS
ncbi:hypothetical protein B9Z55_023024 [Caenorhabditis nigoni]|uniref:ZP domain-containing protein n=1 Tax=Caenorhabditis nigoni TaxID=1611254 RepID=A0A2G5SMS8_9PELO|nr:hypothetical protein B9Z55_023024 [Caenorhabditis nigoni]